MTRAWVWLQVVIGWLPVWALYTTLMLSMHGASFWFSAWAAFKAVACAALLGLLVRRLTKRLHWPRHFRPGFMGAHLIGALAFAFAWVALTGLVELGARLHAPAIATGMPPVIIPFLILGVWLYVMVAGVSYAQLATERAAHAEALAAKSQLAALRSQLNPHFLFNALHTVVQLIPRQPREAAQTAEQLAGLLRTTIEEDRDVVTLDEEWSFVRRYLELEQVRCGDRLVVEEHIDEAARQAELPSFAIQTLVENAVRHGVAPRIEPTTIAVTATRDRAALTVVVADTGSGNATPPGNGTGLRRLRERLAALYGERASLTTEASGQGYTAALRIPQDDADA